MKRSVLTMVAALMAMHVSRAAVLCVAPDGSPDGDGTSINPFNSLPAAISTAYCRTDYCLVAIEPGCYTNAAALWLGNERVMLRGSGMAQTHIVGDVVITADLHIAALTFCGVVSNTGTLLCQDVKLNEPPAGNGQVLGLWREGASDIQHLTWLADTTNALDAVNYETLLAHTYTSFTNYAAAFALADTNWVSGYVDLTALTIADSLIDARGAALSNVMDIVLALAPVSSGTVYSLAGECDFDTPLSQAPPIGSTPRFVKFVSGALAGQCRFIYSCGSESWSGTGYYWYSVDGSVAGTVGDSFEVYDTDPRLGRALADLYVRKAGDTLAGDLWYDVPAGNYGYIGVRGDDSSSVAFHLNPVYGRVLTEYYDPDQGVPCYIGFWDYYSDLGVYKNSALYPLGVGAPTTNWHAATKGYVDSRTIPSTNITDGAITAAKLADGAVSVSKLGEDVDPRYVNAAGDEMTGDLYMNGRAIHYPEVYQGSIYSPSVYSPYLYQPALDYGQLLSDLDANGSTVHGLGAPSQQSDAATKGYVDDSFKGFDYDARYVYIDKYYGGLNGYGGTLRAPFTNFHQALGVLGSNSFYGDSQPVVYQLGHGYYDYPSFCDAGQLGMYLRMGIVGRGAFYKNFHNDLSGYGSTVFSEMGTFISGITHALSGTCNINNAVLYLRDVVVSGVYLYSSAHDDIYCDSAVFLSLTNNGQQNYHGIYYSGTLIGWGDTNANNAVLDAGSLRPGFYAALQESNEVAYVHRAGDVMTGALTVPELNVTNANDWLVGRADQGGNIVLQHRDSVITTRAGTGNDITLAPDGTGEVVAQSSARVKGTLRTGSGGTQPGSIYIEADGTSQDAVIQVKGGYLRILSVNAQGVVRQVALWNLSKGSIVGNADSDGDDWVIPPTLSIDEQQEMTAQLDSITNRVEVLESQMQ